MGRCITINKFYGSCKIEFVYTKVNEIDYVHIYNLFIKEKYRRTGKAKKIIKFAMQKIKNTGYEGKIKIVSSPRDKELKCRMIDLYLELGLEVYDFYG